VWDELPAAFTSEVEDDEDTLAVLLHGSRGRGFAREDSDWDVIRVLTPEAFESRRAAGATLHEKRPAHRLDIVYTTVDLMRALGEAPDWRAATCVTSVVVFDRRGEGAAVVRDLTERIGEAAYADVPEAYDDYLNSFVRSLKSWLRGDELGGRLHAAASAFGLLRALWGLERSWPPFHDLLEGRLPELERRLGWEPGSLRASLLALVDGGDPSLQQRLEERVEALLDARGFQHEWGSDLEQLRALRFPPA
jgi:predicted nucleotidyltransferase